MPLRALCELQSAFWKNNNMYGLDVSCLEPFATTDNFAQPVVGYFDPSCLLTTKTASKLFNFSSCSCEDLQKFEIPFSFEVERTGLWSAGCFSAGCCVHIRTADSCLATPALLHGIASWFDITFDGSSASVKLDTSPSAPGTHWYQCRMLFREPLAVNRTQSVSGKLVFVANKHYSFYVTMTGMVWSARGGCARGMAVPCRASPPKGHDHGHGCVSCYPPAQRHWMAPASEPPTC